MASERWPGDVLARAALVVGLALFGSGCAHGELRRFPMREPLLVDDDQRPFAKKPGEAYGTLQWDFADQTVVRPLSRAFLLERGGEATNVNALDEVPDSSWFTARLGGRGLTPSELAEGPCFGEARLDPLAGGLQVIGAKADGANPGFLVKAPDGRRFLLKLDDPRQPERASAADVVGSLLYHAAGFTTPCNQIVAFRRDDLTIAPGATRTDPGGVKTPLTQASLAQLFLKVVPSSDDRIRAGASLLLSGEPLGPWNYWGTRDDDPNDVVAHEDRRELRGSRLLAALLGHEDARQQNSLAMWIAVPGKGGYVRHALLDFGDSLGNFWSGDAIARRTGHQYHLDLADIARDYLTLGVPRRPWDTASFGPSGPIFGYFDVASFDPEGWRSTTPNAAFSRLTERDGAWMARILARLSDAHLDAAIARARFGDPALSAELGRLLRGRRDKVLRRYLTRLSALTEPRLGADDGQATLCLEDRLVSAGLASAGDRSYQARVREDGEDPRGARPIVATARGVADVCVALPLVERAPAEAPRYLIVDVAAGPADHPSPPLRAHLYALGPRVYRLAGLERPPRW